MYCELLKKFLDFLMVPCTIHVFFYKHNSCFFIVEFLCYNVFFLREMFFFCYCVTMYFKIISILKLLTTRLLDQKKKISLLLLIIFFKEKLFVN